MDQQTETPPSNAEKKEKDATEVATNPVATTNGHNTANGVFKDERGDLSYGEPADSSDEGAGHTKAEDQDEASRLKALTTDVRNQDDLERDIGRQVRQTSVNL